MTTDKTGKPGRPGNPGQSDQSGDIKALRADLASLQALVWNIAKNESIDTTMGYGFDGVSKYLQFAVEQLAEINQQMRPLQLLGQPDPALTEGERARLKNLIAGTKPLKLPGDQLPVRDSPTRFIGDAEPALVPEPPIQLEQYLRSDAS
ncbi:hypothetical protein [Lysobacter sp. CFH 32150]|uniref:hypothetical protein n=1 Tax=Lysobacter sp. CFH 32150 TaxID=2927128 RepID=UPI001FA6CDE3|nr:hypothetical protein [Lysobacter sp. CFH 32150]MCI4568156.1 hypothetical protein [Lysobacter sp. CFH 32150]